MIASCANHGCSSAFLRGNYNASAIASYLAPDFSLYDAITKAKQYLTVAILSGANHKMGLGNGPIDHFYFLENR